MLPERIRDLELSEFLDLLEQEVITLAQAYPTTYYTPVGYACSYLAGPAGPGNGCLFGQVLQQLGFSRESLMNTRGIVSFIMSEVSPDQKELLDWGRLETLRKVQHKQDNGDPWGVAIRPLMEKKVTSPWELAAQSLTEGTVNP